MRKSRCECHHPSSLRLFDPGQLSEPQATMSIAISFGAIACGVLLGLFAL
jgi:hypothetical protein